MTNKLKYTFALKNIVLNEFQVRSSKISLKILIQSLAFPNTAFNEFLIIPNKNIGFLLKFYHGFSKQYHIFELRNLFATFESLKSVEFPLHAASLQYLYMQSLREKCPNTELFLVRIFSHLDWIRTGTKYLSVFSSNARKYGPEITPYWDTFHAVALRRNVLRQRYNQRNNKQR